MQEADVAVTDYISEKGRAAELINFQLFHGKQMIRAEDLTELDGNLSTLDHTRKGEKRYGDQIWRVRLSEGELLVSIEHQTKVHLFMPFRQIGYEIRQYEKQYRNAVTENRKQKNLTSDNFLSGITKEQRFLPVISFTVYWDWKKPWDGEKETKALVKTENLPGELQKKIWDYEMNLLEIREIPDAEVFQTDMKLVFGFLKYADDKDKLWGFVEKHEEEYRNLAEDAYQVIWVLAGEKKLKQLKRKVFDGKERCDMCKALEDMRKESRMEGEKNGRKIGMKTGRKEERKLLNSLTRALICDERWEDLKKAAENIRFQNQLLKEYNLM